MIRIHRLACLQTVILAIAACSSNNPPQPSSSAISSPYEIPAIYAHHSFVWDAPHGVDLLSPEMVATRAFLESTVIMFNPKAEGKTYPGFKETAKGLPYPPDPAVTYTGADVRGTDYLAVLSLDTAGSDSTVLACWDQSGTVQRRSDGSYEQGWGPHPVRFVLHHVQSVTGASSSTQEQGPRSAPAGNVLIGWSATKYSSPLGPQTWDSSAEFDNYEDACRKRHKHGPVFPLNAGVPARVNPDDPQFAPKPAYPGWPAAKEG